MNDEMDMIADDVRPEPKGKAKGKPASKKPEADGLRSFRVQLRHVPFATKSAVVQAASEEEAWEKFCEIAREGKGAKKFKEADVKACETWLSKHGMDQATITEL